jgi:tRNA pseudouridine55 synthase
MIDGVLVIEKPAGPTSHDVVARVRRAIGESRIGHTGTLDPAACGVLPLVVGRATRLARFLSAGEKRYEATVRLGFCTDTGDAQGVTVGTEYGGVLPSFETIEQALDTFRGTFLQQPPVYSAKKIAGRRSYRVARAAARLTPHADADRERAPVAALQPVPVHVSALTLAGVEDDRVRLEVTCSAGFYVRSLASDLGRRLGTGGHLTALRRTRSGDYALSDAISLDRVEHDPAAAVGAVVPLARLLPHLSFVVLTSEGVMHARQGRDLQPQDLSGSASGAPDRREGRTSASSAAGGVDRSDDEGWVRMIDSAGELVGLAQVRGVSGLLHPAVVLV